MRVTTSISLVIFSIILLAVLARGIQDRRAQIRSDIAADIVDNTTGEISPEDIREVLYDITDLLVTTPEIDGRIATWARYSPTGTIPDSVLPVYLRQVNLAVPASWARSLPAPTGTIPFNRLPFPDCTNGQLLERGTTAWTCGTDDTGTTGLDAAGVRDQVSTMLLTGLISV